MSEPTQEKDKRVTVSASVNTKFAEVKAALRERGVKDFTITDFVDLIFSKSNEAIFQEIIEDKTPDEYRIMAALKDEGLRSEMLKFLEKRKPKQSSKETN